MFCTFSVPLSRSIVNETVLHLIPRVHCIIAPKLRVRGEGKNIAYNVIVKANNYHTANSNVTVMHAQVHDIFISKPGNNMEDAVSSAVQPLSFDGVKVSPLDNESGPWTASTHHNICRFKGA